MGHKLQYKNKIPFPRSPSPIIIFYRKSIHGIPGRILQDFFIFIRLGIIKKNSINLLTRKVPRPTNTQRNFLLQPRLKKSLYRRK